MDEAERIAMHLRSLVRSTPCIHQPVLLRAERLLRVQAETIKQLQGDSNGTNDDSATRTTQSKPE